MLSQAPFTIQAGLDLVQVASLVPPPEPRQVQVDDPPQEPAIFHELVPAEQAN